MKKTTSYTPSEGFNSEINNNTNPNNGDKMTRQQRRKMKRLLTNNHNNPISRLERKGFDILTDSDGKIKVGVDFSFNVLEGSFVWGRTEIIPDEQIHLIDKENINNYNSLWESTKSGWDSEDKLVFPYINVNGEWVRWDNHTLRKLGGFYSWDEQNHQKFISKLLKSSEKITPILIFEGE